VEDITEALWGDAGEPEHSAQPQQKIYAKIAAWRSRRIEGIVMKRTWVGKVRNVSCWEPAPSIPKGWLSPFAATELCLARPT
jgi:hypothetical protein